MIIGVGIDIVDITRFKKTLKNPQFKLKYFSPTEHGLSVESLAGRFAAREAFFKSMSQQELFDRKNIEIFNEKSGKPRIALTGELNKYGNGKNFYLTISHCPEYAVAMVVVEQAIAEK